MQILTSFLINILALGTGASYGIANVLLSKLEANNKTHNSTEIIESNILNRTSPFQFTINADEASWIGMDNIMQAIQINFCQKIRKIYNIIKLKKIKILYSIIQHDRSILPYIFCWAYCGKIWKTNINDDR